MQKHFTLLIADDESAILRGLSQSIAWDSIGVKVVASERDGRSALHALRRFVPDIAIMDICMPELDGLQVIEKAKAEGLPTTFILLSGYDNFSYAQQAIQAGVAAYLLKPINKEELLSTVREQCDKLQRKSSPSLIQENLSLVKDAARPNMRADMHESQLLLNIAVGRLNNSHEIRRMLETLGSPIPFEGVCAIIIHCPLSLHEEAIRAIEEVFFCCPHIVFLRELDQIYLAVHVRSRPGARESLKRISKEYISLMRSRGISTTATIGTFAPTLMELPLSLRAARSAQQYRLYDLPDGVYDAALLECTPMSGGNVPRWQSAELVEAILVCNEPLMQEKLNDFLNSLFYIPMPPPNYVLGMCAHLIMDIERQLLPYASEAFPISMKDAHVQLYAQPSLSALKQWLYDTLFQLSVGIAAGNMNKHAPIIDKAKAYIEQNLLKKLLLNDVAAHVHLSESYFAALFKNCTGQSFRNYLLDRKMDKARELLRNRNRSIAEVAELLGYEDYRAFTRAFKKHTGLRPSELYKSVRNEKNSEEEQETP